MRQAIALSADANCSELSDYRSLLSLETRLRLEAKERGMDMDSVSVAHNKQRVGQKRQSLPRLPKPKDVY